ncbi:MAG: TolB family protein [Gemmatimonadaceae bacterium]
MPAPSRKNTALRCILLAAISMPVGGACSDATSPDHMPAAASPAFIFVSDSSGNDQLYRFRNDSIVRLTFSDMTDRDPHVAADRLVFTSYRDGDPEIYVSDLEGVAPRRLTESVGLDEHPVLGPGGGTIAFVSNRGGTPRLWTMRADGTNPSPLATGATEYVPERSPAWSPAGDQLAFTSTRTGTSQVYIVPSTGGSAQQLTSESGGAFDPQWSADGGNVYFVASGGVTEVRMVNIATLEVAPYASSAAGLGEPACYDHGCLAVNRAYGDNGDIVFYSGAGTQARILVNRASNDRSPAVLGIRN